MDGSTHTLITQAQQLAQVLPLGLMQTLADLIAAASPGDWGGIRASAMQAVPQPHLRAQVQALLALWEHQAPSKTPAEVAMALRTAALTTQALRGQQQIELVWTGPRASGVSMRRTDQALLQVIDAAQRTLLVVSFAVYKIPAVREALVRAASRGVSLRICVEAPEPSGQKMAHDTIRALGAAVAQRAVLISVIIRRVIGYIVAAPVAESSRISRGSASCRLLTWPERRWERISRSISVK